MSGNRLSVLPAAAPPAPSLTARSIHQEMRRNTAMAAGIEAISLQAFDEGEATAEQMEHVAQLAGQLRADLDKMATAMVELVGNQREGEA